MSPLSLEAALLTSQRTVLEAVLARTRALGPGCVALFDIDDTVLYTSRRTLRILHEFARQMEREPEHFRETRFLLAAGVRDIRYSIGDTAKAAGVTDEGILAHLREFWFKRFFTNEYLLEDKPVPGAAGFCRELAEAGARVVYLTGRDETMEEGTLKVLGRHGFPLPGAGAELILKPRFDTPDFEFKVSALDRVAAMGEVAAGFENEPAHINLFQERFPAGRMVFVDSRHSGKPISPLPSVGRIRDYLRA